jgi:hypothetical protein
MLTPKDVAYIKLVNRVVWDSDRCVTGGGVHFTEERSARIFAYNRGMQVLHAPGARFPWLARL